MADSGSPPRWFFGVLLPEEIQLLVAHRGEIRLGSEIFRKAQFARCNWHQSVSDICTDPQWVERYLVAGRKVMASAFTIRLDRLESRSGVRRDWALCASQTPEGFPRLKAAIRRSLLTEGIKNRCGKTQHVTLSYRAPFHFDACSVEPIEWTIDRFMLLRGGGKPYRYDVEEQWLLNEPIPERPSPQSTLF